MKNHMTSIAVGACLLLSSAGVAFADNLHNGTINGTGTNTTGQSGTHASPNSPPTIAQCGSGGTLGNGTTPGNAANNNGSPFSATGQAGTVYAGNPDTASAANSKSGKAFSQYDVACAQQDRHLH